MRRYILNKKHGFTLAELMAVIAIIAIIASLGLGSYRQAMDKARMKEGVAGAHTLAGALDEFFYEHNKYTRDMKKLPAALSGTTKRTEGEIVAGHFKYTIEPASEPDTEPQAIKAQVVNGGYSIWVYLSSQANLRATPVRCAYTNLKTKDMCMTGGYKNCNDDIRMCS